MQSIDWKAAAEEQLGVTLGQCQRLSGGDFAQSYCAVVDDVVSPSALAASVGKLQAAAGIEVAQSDSEDCAILNAGDNLFIKTHRNPPPNHFTTEARGLCWLKMTDSISVPAVLGADDNSPYLAMQWIELGTGQARSSRGEMEFGAQLAKLHQSPCSVFGRIDGRTTGSLGLPNKACDSWSEFYASQRLIPLMEIAASRRSLPVKSLEKIEQLSMRLDEFAAADTRPSLLHGDLWAGNRLVDARGQSWIIDPACHGGHREFDLAMMRLFGGFDENCHSAYQETWPLDDGWRDRVHLHQLAPLIVHAIKFGSAYRQATEDALNRYID